MRRFLSIPVTLFALSLAVDAHLDSSTGAQAQAPAPSSVPPPPTGCGTTSAFIFNNTPVAIPDSGGGVASSTILISGVGTFVWDVEVTTFITHTFSADLDFTLKSPAGTIVTLSSDNGGSFDDVFNGTLWDDDANFGGQVPYDTNAGLVTDHPYVNGVAAGPLVPEEPLAAFRGENPNGVWTLTITDDVATDVGFLVQWGLTLTALTSAPYQVTTAFSNTIPVPIPDSGGPVATSSISVSGLGTVTSKVALRTNLTHTWPADLDFTLQSPNGSIVTLSSDNGGSNDNVFAGTLWDDNANPEGQVPYATNAGLVGDHPYVAGVVASPLAPEESFGAFMFEFPNGIWTITIDDDTGLEVGTLNSWTLYITTAVCSPAPVRSPFDFDGDGATDWPVTRNGSLIWHTLNSLGYTGTVWGDHTEDVRVPGDYDGDGKTDIAIWRPSTGTFWVRQSSNGAAVARQWGVIGDDPRIVGDYDGDGKTDFAVYRPGNPSVWWVLRSSNGTFFGLGFGQTGDKPAPGDYDGDRRADFAVARGPGAATFYIQQSVAGFLAVPWGLISDSILSGDYDGDGKSDISVARQVSGTWEHYVRRSSNGSFYGQVWGLGTDALTPGDFDGDGKTDLAVWRGLPAPSTFYVLRSFNGALLSQPWGVPTDFPVPFSQVH